MSENTAQERWLCQSAPSRSFNGHFLEGYKGWDVKKKDEKRKLFHKNILSVGEALNKYMSSFLKEIFGLEVNGVLRGRKESS